MNVVVFEVLIDHRLQPLLGEVSTRSAHGLRRVWAELAAGFGVRPEEARRVYCQWEPTRDDRAFLAAELPAVAVSFSFPRPVARRDWGEPTPEFALAVAEFERAVAGSGTVGVRPWWQYWDGPGEESNPFAAPS